MSEGPLSNKARPWSVFGNRSVLPGSTVRLARPSVRSSEPSIRFTQAERCRRRIPIRSRVRIGRRVSESGNPRQAGITPPSTNTTVSIRSTSSRTADDLLRSSKFEQTSDSVETGSRSPKTVRLRCSFLIRRAVNQGNLFSADVSPPPRTVSRSRTTHSMPHGWVRADSRAVRRIADLPTAGLPTADLLSTPNYDVAEAVDVEARAAHQRAVHILVHDQRVDVVRLDAAAVDHMAMIAGRGAEP